jgi:DNA replication and repair protein RecF
MKIKKLYLHQFRNHQKREFEFSAGINWIEGNNALGKTNLIEALYLLSTGRSFRTPQIGQLIQENEPFFFLEAHFEKDRVDQVLKVSFDGEVKKVQFNVHTHSHFAPLIGLLPHILYAPEDCALISGMPAYRRKFLDLHLSQLDTLYLHHLARFHRALRQRNALLKQKSEAVIDPWEYQMAQSASFLMRKRKEFIEELGGPLEEKMLALSSQKDRLTISYLPSLSFDCPKQIEEHWRRNRAKELLFGSTLTGPHRDDLTFLIDHLPAKSHASVGQKHSIIAALRLCQWKHLYAHTGYAPLFSIDDFGAHLDPKRQKAFEAELLRLGQVFLTSPIANREIFPEKQIIRLDA